MKNYTFNFEIQTLMEQFVAAFNDVIVKRYDNTKTLINPLSGNKVLYVYAPKQRVFNALNNPAPGGLTVPVISVSIASISRDNQRVFNKNEGFNINYDPKINSEKLFKKIPQPVPINIGVNMTIVTKYQNDMEQIISNFVPYCDPYIVISWKLPSLTASRIPYEIRSEVLWSGNLNMQYPIELGPTQPFRVTADTSFTIKGWLFKKMDEYYKKIYTINSDFHDMSCLENAEYSNILQDIDELYQEDDCGCPCPPTPPLPPTPPTPPTSSPTYSLMAYGVTNVVNPGGSVSVTATEGGSISVVLNTTNVSTGTNIPYTVTGITANDLSSGSLTGNFTITNNSGNVFFSFSSDALSESETFTITLDGLGVSLAINILDYTSPPPSPITRPLFDRSSFSTVPNPYRIYLNDACFRFETYIKMNDSVWDLIKTLKPSWNGIPLNNYQEVNYGVGDPKNNVLAECGPSQYLDIQPGPNGLKFQSTGFNLKINKFWESNIPSGASSPYTGDDWRNILAHEIGHGLGIGAFWDSFYAAEGAKPPTNSFLDGSFYVNAQLGYNQITTGTYSKIPLESGGGIGTGDGHWEDNFRNGSAIGANGISYPGIENELMVGYYNKGMISKLSKLTIGALKDFGYEEVNPGASEGTPVVVNSLVSKLNNNKQDTCVIKLNCDCSSHFSNMECLSTVYLPLSTFNN